MKTISLSDALKRALPERPITDDDLTKIRERLRVNLKHRLGFSEAENADVLNAKPPWECP